MQPTKVFAKAGLDNITSAMCRHQQRFGLDVQFSALVNNFNCIFSIGHLYRAEQSMNSLPSQMPGRCAQKKYCGMKFIALIMLFTTLKGFSQDWEYLQTDTVYKMSRVKSCTVRFYGQQGSRIVFSLDTNGRVIDRVQFNSTGEKFYNRNIFQYNEKGKIAFIIYFTYWHLENNQIVEDSLPHPASHWTTCTLHYDLSDRLAHSLYTDSAGKVSSENTYTYNPITLRSKMFSSIDSSIITSTIFYDAINVIKRSNYYREKAGKVISKWEVVYENSFDELGRIFKRKKTIPTDPNWGMEYVYEYDSNGLLMVLNSRRIDCMKDCSHQYLVYEYTYWDENCIQTTVRR